MEIITVGQFIRLLNQVFTDMPEFAVEGEVLSLKYSKGNAVFIELKDPKEQAIIRVSNFAPWVEGLKQISEGMQVVVYGRPEIYANYGSLSLKVRKIEPVGAGALKQAFENLQRALAAEGLFAPERKRALPAVISRIALITGKDSAAYADFTKILLEHNTGIAIDFFPVLVQGQRSAAEIVKALAYNSKRQELDAIALIRGGGSLEDLASFNSEQVARAIFASKVPVIVGVGHEVDTSIADLVADIRASTPSQAAYYLAQQNYQFLQVVDQLVQTMEQQVKQFIPTPQSLDSYLAYWQQQLRLIIPSPVEIEGKMRIIELGLTKLQQQISKQREQITAFPNYARQLTQQLANSTLIWDKHVELLEAYNPRNTLKRGYTLVSQQGKYLARVKAVDNQQPLTLHFYDGDLSLKS